MRRTQSPPEWQKVADIIFTSLFTLEMSLKLAALGFQYWKNGWNLLDAFVVFEVGKRRLYLQQQTGRLEKNSAACSILVGTLDSRLGLIYTYISAKLIKSLPEASYHTLLQFLPLPSSGTGLDYSTRTASCPRPTKGFKLRLVLFNMIENQQIQGKCLKHV